jgi:hypothetical protein
MQPSITSADQSSEVVSSLDLSLVITDRQVLAYLARFPSEELQCEKALEALKIGVIAIQSASPTLDTQVVQEKFADLDARWREQAAEFHNRIEADLARYFSTQNGVVPKSLDEFLGERGMVNRFLQTFFDPATGKLSKLLQEQIGPHSTFGRSLDPQNKTGVLSLIETRVQELVEAKLNAVLTQFSLDADGSAMSRLHTLLNESFNRLHQTLGVQMGARAEADRGHVKGMEFEADLYQVFARLGARFDDVTEMVRNTAGEMARRKTGDFLAILGESSGAPGYRMVVEVKNTTLSPKLAQAELQEAKQNRKAGTGVMVFARGTEPVEIGNFRRIGEDFYVTVDRDDLAAGQPLVFLEAAYQIARALAVSTTRTEAAGQLNLQQIHDQVDALATWSDRLAEMVTKARTIHGHGLFLEKHANELKADLETRVAIILKAAACGGES